MKDVRFSFFFFLNKVSVFTKCKTKKHSSFEGKLKFYIFFSFIHNAMLRKPILMVLAAMLQQCVL